MIFKEKEKDIENAILDWLLYKGIFAWKIENAGVYDPKKKVFRSIHRRIKGISDILAIYRTYPMAIEVKSSTGKLSKHQEEFLQRFKENGGIAFVARSIDDVAERLSHEDRKIEMNRGSERATLSA